MPQQQQQQQRESAPPLVVVSPAAAATAPVNELGDDGRESSPVAKAASPPSRHPPADGERLATGAGAALLPGLRTLSSLPLGGAPASSDGGGCSTTGAATTISTVPLASSPTRDGRESTDALEGVAASELQALYASLSALTAEPEAPEDATESGKPAGDSAGGAAPAAEPRDTGGPAGDDAVPPPPPPPPPPPLRNPQKLVRPKPPPPEEKQMPRIRKPAPPPAPSEQAMRETTPVGALPMATGSPLEGEKGQGASGGLFESMPQGLMDRLLKSSLA